MPMCFLLMKISRETKVLLTKNNRLQSALHRPKFFWRIWEIKADCSENHKKVTFYVESSNFLKVTAGDK